MPERDAIARSLFGELAAERDVAFSRLRRIPSTQVFRFLDYVDALDRAGQDQLLESIADRAACYFHPPVPYPYAGNAAYQAFAQAASTWAMAEGIRYTGLKLLDALHGQPPGNASVLALTPPDGFLVGNSPVAQVPLLKKLVKKVLADRFAAKGSDLGSGIWRYQGQCGESSVQIMVHYGRTLADAQLKYEVKLPEVNVPGFCFETLFNAGFGWWDYLTEENAERSVQLLGELIEWLARLSARIS